MAGQLVLPRVHVLVLCDDIEPSAVEEGVFDLRGCVHGFRRFPFRTSTPGSPSTCR